MPTIAVDVYRLGKDAEPEVAGTITWNGAEFVCSPADSDLLHHMLGDEILGNSGPVTAKDGAEFINNLCRQYHGSYIWVSKPRTSDDGGWTPVGNSAPVGKSPNNGWTPIGVNVYCPTGKGGGKDPTCSPGGQAALDTPSTARKPWDGMPSPGVMGSSAGKGEPRASELKVVGQTTALAQERARLEQKAREIAAAGWVAPGETTKLAGEAIHLKQKQAKAAEKAAEMGAATRAQHEEKLAKRREKALLKRQQRGPEEAEASRVKREARRVKYKARQAALEKAGGGEAVPPVPRAPRQKKQLQPPPAGGHDQAGTLPDTPERTDLEHQAFTDVKVKPKGGIEKTEDVKLGDGTQGFYKPEDGEDKRKDTRRFVHGYHWAREVMSSVAASLFGMDDMVPVTVDHDDGHGGHGALRRWIEHADVGANKYTDAEKFDGEKDVARAAAFDFATGNTDRHGRNWMVKDGTGKLVLIDHGLGFPSSNTPAWGNAQIMEHCRKMKIPEECRHWIDQWDKMEKHMKALGFRDVEIKATHERVAALADPKYKKFEDLRGVWDTGYGYPGHEAGMSPAAHWKRQAW